MLNALVPTALFSLLLRILLRGRRWGGAVVLALAVTVWMASSLPTGEWIYEALTTRFPPFAPDDKPVAGIIVLGNSSWTGEVGNRYPPPHETEDRRQDALELARRYPDALVVATGGPPDPTTNVADADLVVHYFATQGIRPERMVAERQSHNTFENARFSYPLAKPKRGERWLLVTSSWHMPRAIGVFRQAGFPVVAVPAAKRDGYVTRRFPAAASRWMHAVHAWKEFEGLWAYNILGRTSAIFPAP